MSTTPDTNHSNPMTCTEFQAILPELIGSGADVGSHPHLVGCALCQALLADLESIAAAARQLLAPVEPPEQLWAQIESALRAEEEVPRESA